MTITDIKALMGRLVVVTKTIGPRYDSHNKRFWVSKPVHRGPRTGWLTGCRWVQTGVCHPRHHWDDEGRLEETAPRTLIALVVFWPSMDPVRVPMDGLRVAAENDPPPEWRTWPWSEKDKARLRQEMVEWPRDEQGRWVEK
jgi:hypothetical protein